MKAVLLAATALALAACSTNAVISTPIADSGGRVGVSAINGIPYSLPIGRIRLDIYAGVNSHNTIVGLKAAAKDSKVPVVLAPDPKARYMLTYQPSPSADDELCAGLDSNGLLSDVRFASADRMDDVFVSLAEAAAVGVAGVGGPAATAFPAAEAERLTGLTWEAQPLTTVEFNPLDANEVQAAQDAIGDALEKRNVGPAIRSVLERNKPTFLDFTLDGEKPEHYSKCVAPDTSVNGVFVRSVKSMLLEVKPAGDLGGDVLMAAVTLPDRCSNSAVEITRARGVLKSTQINFNSDTGALDKYDVSKPSEILRFAGLPLRVTGAVVEAPARFFTAIAQATHSKADMVEARAKLVQANAALLKAEKGQDVSVGNSQTQANSTSIGSGSSAKNGFDVLQCLDKPQ